jgi:hypothetical protein
MRKISDIPKFDRPREKLQHKGVEGLSFLMAGTLPVTLFENSYISF